MCVRLCFSVNIVLARRRTAIGDAMGSMSNAWLAAMLTLVAVGWTAAELTPPYFNLAEGRKISATATCGVETEEPELYCKLVGANTENYNHSQKLIQGQVSIYDVLYITIYDHRRTYSRSRKIEYFKAIL